jgi:3-oxoacyl-[acyl-carrier-protein] synthase III
METGSVVPTQVPANNYCFGKLVGTNNVWITPCASNKERCSGAECEYALVSALKTGLASLETTSLASVDSGTIIHTTAGTITSDYPHIFDNHGMFSSASIPFVLDEVNHYYNMSEGDMVLSSTY